MSRLSGVCYWDSRPIAANELASFVDADVKAAASNVVIPQSGVAMQAEVLRFDRHSDAERQPYRFGSGSLLTWDGRLDNRDELLATLHHSLSSESTDVAIVAAAFMRWGDDCWPRLLGDWSLALWDATRRAVVLSRDYMGNRPLYYHAQPQGLVWATKLEELAAYCGVLDQADDTYLAGSLTFGVPPDVTPFAGIRAVRGGHVLVATAQSGVSSRRYWTFTPAVIRHRDPRDYEDQLRKLLFEAVRVRLRSNRPVWAHLSGGWDSSSIVCIADALVRRGLVDAPALKTVSIVCSGSPESDETEFIEPIERWCGRETTRLEFEGYRTWDELEGRRLPVPSSRTMLERPAQAAGDPIVLSGQMGDLVMWKSGHHRVSIVEPLHEGHPWQFLRLCVQRAKYRRQPLPTTLLKLGIQTYLPGVRYALASRRVSTARAIETTGGRSGGAAAFGVTPALFARAPRGDETRYPSVADFPFVKRDIVQSLYRFADDAAMTTRLVTPEVLTTFPYAHRPLVDFVLSTPQLVFWDPASPRMGMKRALAEVLPPELLQRRTKGAPASVLNRAKRIWLESFRELPIAQSVNSWQLVQRGAVDPDALRRALNATSAGAADVRIDFVMKSAYLEAWLRAIGDAARPTNPVPLSHSQVTAGECAANALGMPQPG